MAEGIGVVSVGDYGHYFTIAEFRAIDSAFADQAAYPDVDIDEARTWAEERFEEAANCAWVARTGEYMTIGDGGLFISLPHRDVRSLTSVEIDGVTLTAEELEALTVTRHGLVKRVEGWTEDALIEVVYTYGKTVIPAPVKKAVLLLAKNGIVPSNLSDRAVTESTDAGFVRLSIAAAGGRTGIPEVDAIAADFGHARVFAG